MRAAVSAAASDGSGHPPLQSSAPGGGAAHPLLMASGRIRRNPHRISGAAGRILSGICSDKEKTRNRKRHKAHRAKTAAFSVPNFVDIPCSIAPIHHRSGRAVCPGSEINTRKPANADHTRRTGVLLRHFLSRTLYTYTALLRGIRRAAAAMAAAWRGFSGTQQGGIDNGKPR